MSRRVLIVSILLAVLAPIAGATARKAAADNLGLFVVFHPNAPRITVTLASGQSVGTAGGAPTVIPAGQYDIFMDDSANVEGPTFDLNGPGVAFREDMFYGEDPSETFSITFLPGSTYTWRNLETPSQTFTFVTSGGSSSTGTGGAGSSANSTTSKSGGKAQSSLVGSDVVDFRGSLDAIVYASGKLSLTRNGKKVTSLKTGKYTFSVDDESKKAGFTVKSLRGNATNVTSASYVGSHDATLNLKPGRWFFYTPGGKQTTFYVIS